MKKKAFFILTLLMMILLTVNSFADGVDSASNYFAFDDNVNISKEVLGDIYSAGREITVKENVSGDVIALGEIINITSKDLNGNIRCGAQTLNINSKNVKNITSFGQNINIGENTAAKAIYISAENINFKGVCEGFYATGDTIIINGKINGDVNVTCDELIIANKGEVTGKIEVYSPKEPIVNSKVTMNDIQYTKIDNSDNENKLNSLVGFGTIISILASLLLGVVLYSIFKKFFIKNDDLLVREPLPVILGGMASFILVPIISLLSLFTIIALPLGIISLITYFTIVYVSPVIIGIVLGRIILKNKNPYVQLLSGILIVRILTLLPMIGSFVWLISTMIVQGLIVYEFYRSIKYKENKIEKY